jgi:hypothetical protein
MVLFYLSGVNYSFMRYKAIKPPIKSTLLS